MASTSTSQAPVQLGQPGQQTDISSQSRQNSGDWTQSLLQLATTAQLKKHAFNLQFQTAHVLAAHQSLQEKSSTIEDIKAQKNWLERYVNMATTFHQFSYETFSERLSLLNQLRLVNEDREKADALEADIQKECDHYRAKIQMITDGEYAEAKKQVDALRAQLGMPPMRTLQSVLDEASATYLQQRRLAHALRPAVDNTSASSRPSAPSDAPVASQSAFAPGSSIPRKRPPKHGRPGDEGNLRNDEPPKKKRGRPKGSRNKSTIAAIQGTKPVNNTAPASTSAGAVSASAENSAEIHAQANDPSVPDAAA
ncbi:hypothetical protein BS47DRAFT_1399178 [Hydnum rufescens UP504]|uniref:Uncharacterized protein n=1 Tax=Hydnum rufescens UP504 TaxID=1448309 RepID=A0A9P6DME8_9AGAM|nr:hypothetical protein BS47DRAFT_1399178 [Hydnum rufescens UP504]